MTGTTTEFIPGFNLFFTNNGQKKLYELLGVKTHKQFVKLLDSEDGLSNEDLEKMILAGLLWEKKGLTLGDVQDIIENEFYIKLGKNFEELNEIIIDAFVASGLMNGKRVQAIRKVKEMTAEELENKMFEIMSTKKKPGEDKGEAGKT